MVPVALIAIAVADYHLCVYRLATIGHTGGGQENGEPQAITFHRPLLKDIYDNDHYALSICEELKLFDGYKSKLFKKFAEANIDQTYISCELVYKDDCEHCKTFTDKSAPYFN